MLLKREKRLNSEQVRMPRGKKAIRENRFVCLERRKGIKRRGRRKKKKI